MSAPAIELHPLSYGADGRGRLFVVDNELVRGVYAAGVDDILAVIDNPEMQRLMREGKLSKAARYSGVDIGYPLAIAHPLQPRVTLPFEWTGIMLKDAGHCFLDVAECAARNGLLLADAHPWNVIFQGPHPQVVDFGAFRLFVNPRTGQERTFHPGDCFLRSFLGPLEVMANQKSSLARAFIGKNLEFSHRNLPPFASMRVFKSFVRKSIVRNLPRVAVRVARKVRARTGRYTIPATEQSILRTCAMLRKKLDAISFPDRPSGWSYYHPDSAIEGAELSSEKESKANRIRAVVEKLAPSSITDLGCNRGLYAMLFAKTGTPVVAIDSDDRCISDLYLAAKKQNLPITPLVMSVLRPSPTPALPGGHVVGVSRRLAGELALALALVHHLTLAQGCDFPMLTDILCLYTSKWVILEFVGADDPTISRWRRRVPEWYTEDSLLDSLRRRFTILEVLPSQVSTRKLIVLEKR